MSERAVTASPRGLSGRTKADDNLWIFLTMLIGAALSLTAALILSIEAIELARNPDASLSCSVNAVINCASVSLHPSASLFGFPNSFIGLMAEPVVITVALAGLMGVKFPRRFMFAAQIGYSLGFIFAFYLFFTSMLVIRALCPWCLLVTLSTTLVFFSLTRYNVREENLYLPKRWSGRLKKIVARDYDKLAMMIIIVLAIAWIILQYGNELWG